MDIDFITDLTNGFEISLSDNPQAVTGNRAVLNRFQITLLTNVQRYILDGESISNGFGGDIGKYVGVPHILDNPQSIGVAISTAIDMTVKSMKSDEPDRIMDTEKILGASLISVETSGDTVSVVIEVIPVVVETFSDLIVRLPIVKRN